MLHRMFQDSKIYPQVEAGCVVHELWMIPSMDEIEKTLGDQRQVGDNDVSCLPYPWSGLNICCRIQVSQGEYSVLGTEWRT